MAGERVQLQVFGAVMQSVIVKAELPKGDQWARLR